MSKKDKAIERLLSTPKDYTYDEAKSLLQRLGYLEHTKGRTSGSRVAFYHAETKGIFMLDKPHPQNNLKHYVLKNLIKFLEEQGDIE